VPAPGSSERRAHCFDGAVFAAAALRKLGFPPLVLELVPNERDDDHLIALYKRDGLWGAVAKSNFVGLRFREPVFRNLRELVLSYFEQFFNVAGEKTLRAYTLPLDLTRFDALGWTIQDGLWISLQKRSTKNAEFPSLRTRRCGNCPLRTSARARSACSEPMKRGFSPPPLRLPPCFRRARSEISVDLTICCVPTTKTRNKIGQAIAFSKNEINISNQVATMKQKKRLMRAAVTGVQFH